MPRSTRTESAAGADPFADRLRAALSAEGRSEQRMFGGIGFMLHGNMVVGTSKRGMLVRVGKDAYARALARPGARAMDMRGQPIEGYVFVDPSGLSEAALREWIELALAFVQTLPRKPPKPESKTKGARK